MKNIEKLTFIFMQSLYLNVENRTGVYFDSVMLADIFRQTNLVLVLDIHKFLLGLLVVRINLQPVNLGKVCNPVRSDMGAHPVCEKRIAVKQETPLGNTVGLVIEFLRHHLIEILKLLIL